MLRKLLKYEFRSMGKEFLYLWYGVLALAIINRFVLTGPLISGDVSEEMQAFLQSVSLSSPLPAVFIFAFVAVMIAMVVLTLIFIIQRFYKGLLGTEGYLMNTLPVNSWQLISAKLIGAVTLTAINGIIAILAVFLMIPDSLSVLRQVPPMLREILHTYGAGSLSFLPTLLIASLLSMIKSALHLYLSMAIGHIFTKHRVAMSIVAYIGINMIGNTINSILAPLFIRLEPLRSYVSSGSFWPILLLLWLSIAGAVLICALYFFITNRILKENLNLE